ncbi:PAS domain-containing protein [Aquibium sp. A9E412]|uniref:PAS domain-containing protein n=1 Tax=Aquibium sp. A9E412 TaxID=2976767 RepID=UPI0025B17D45|nr:PAS domain-containing protein [Aquibium sp. A9E412]MDN2567931.1 PAS domain-containing protein [Aquibium sp. A9E412]
MTTVGRWRADAIDEYTWDQFPVSITIADPAAPDCPLVYVNRAFEETTGYAANEVIGRNCRFLQGPETDRAAVQRVREALDAGTAVEATLLNYRKDGATFWNELHLAPLRDADKRIAYFIGIQRPVASPEGTSPQHVAATIKLQEIQHRVKNHLAMIVSLIRMHAHNAPDEASDGYGKLARRVESLQLLYDQLTEKSSRSVIADNNIQLDAYLAKIVRTMVELDPRDSIRVRSETERIDMPVELATHLGMLVSEIVTNALRHAFQGRDGGLIAFDIARLADGRVRLRIADDGIGMAEDAEWPSPRSLGGRIIKSMVGALGAEISIVRDGGTTFEIVVPVEP